MLCLGGLLSFFLNLKNRPLGALRLAAGKHMKKIVYIFSLIITLFAVPFTSFAAGYEELIGSTTLGSANTTISVTGLSGNPLRLSCTITGMSGSDKIGLKFNNDGSNYGYRGVKGGPAEYSQTTNDGSILVTDNSDSTDFTLTATIGNIASTNHTVNFQFGGYGNSRYAYGAGAWNDTTSITSIQVETRGASVTFGAGSKCIVYAPNTNAPAAFPSNADGYLRNNGSGTLTWDNASTLKTFQSLNNVENTALSTWAGSTNIVTAGTITTGTWNATTLAVNKGGTGQTSYTDGQLLIGNTTGNTLSLATLTAGTNMTVTNGSGSITLASSGGSGTSLPADAAGWLENDGAGTLSWSNPPGTGGSTTTTCTTGSGDTWTPCQPFGGLDVLFVIAWFLSFVIFLAVAFWPSKKI